MGLNILLLDKEGNIEDSIKGAMKNKGKCKVWVTRNRHDALVVIKKIRDIHLVLVDIPNGDSDKVDFCKSIRELNGQLTVPVLKVSDNRARERCIRAGLDRFLLKPFDPFSVFGRLRRARDIRNLFSTVHAENTMTERAWNGGQVTNRGHSSAGRAPGPQSG